MAFGKVPPRLLAAPNGTADVEVSRQGIVETKTVIKDRGVVMRTETTYEHVEIEDPGSTPATISGGNRVLQALEYQSVETVVKVTLPVPNEPKAIKRGFKTVWQIVSEELNDRAVWAADNIRALVLMKRESEGKR